MPSDDLIELAEAARFLGVHQSTLRRWADAGKVPHVRTLSGRRRFNRSSLSQVREIMLAPDQEVEKVSPGQISLDNIRRSEKSSRPVHSKWFANLDEDQRLLFRYSGQRLMDLMLEYINRSGNPENTLDEGRQIARNYGRFCRKANLSMSETVDAFLTYRRLIIESVHTSPSLHQSSELEGNPIYVRAIEFYDDLLSATIDSYNKLKDSG